MVRSRFAPPLLALVRIAPLALIGACSPAERDPAAAGEESGAETNMLYAVNGSTSYRNILWSTPNNSSSHCWYYREQKAADAQGLAEYNHKWKKSISMQQYLLTTSARLNELRLEDRYVLQDIARKFDEERKQAIRQGTWTFAACGGTIATTILSLAFPPAGVAAVAGLAVGLATGASACFGNSHAQTQRAKAIDYLANGSRNVRRAETGAGMHQLEDPVIRVLVQSVKDSKGAHQAGAACAPSNTIFR